MLHSGLTLRRAIDVCKSRLCKERCMPNLNLTAFYAWPFFKAVQRIDSVVYGIVSRRVADLPFRVELRYCPVFYTLGERYDADSSWPAIVLLLKARGFFFFCQHKLQAVSTYFPLLFFFFFAKGLASWFVLLEVSESALAIGLKCVHDLTGRCLDTSDAQMFCQKGQVTSVTKESEWGERRMQSKEERARQLFCHLIVPDQLIKSKTTKRY